MRYIIVNFLLITWLGLTGQVCNVCPSGASTILQSTFAPTALHQWTCTNGFNSTLVSPTFNPTENCLCYLKVDDGVCIAYDTLTIEVCNCTNSPCVGLGYNSSSNTLTFTPTGTINSPIATDVIQYRREQQTGWTNVPGGNTLSGCDVRAYLNVTPYCDYSGGEFKLGYTRSICAGTIVQYWQWRGNDGSAITGVPAESQETDWVSFTTSQLANIGNGGVLDIFGRVLNNPNVFVISKIRLTYDGSGTACTDITSSVITQGQYLYDFETRRIVTYSNGCSPDTCYTNINLPDDESCQVGGYLSRVNYGSACTTALFMSSLNMAAPITYQWKYNGSNTAFNPPEYQQGGYCLVGMPYGEYCAVATDANGCQVTDCYTYQEICTSNVTISLSGTILTATPTGCTGTAVYQWRRFQVGSWTNIGTGTTYNTAGVTGQYQVSLTCSGPPSCTSISEYEYINPCNVSVGISVGASNLTANVTGCGGSSISYTWQRWNGSTWVTTQTSSSISTNESYTPVGSGLYRVLINCNGCVAQNQASISIADPCQDVFVQINSSSTVCSSQGINFNRTISGGTAPYTTQWYVDFSFVSNFSSFSWSSSTPGSYTIQVRVTDANNCQYTDTRNINVVSCCNLSTSISPSSTTICTDASQSYSITTSGGSGAVSTNWFSQYNGGSSISEGSGSIIILNKSLAGNYTIIAVSTDQSGCQSTAFSSLSVNACTVCSCNPTIAVNQNCSLILGINGSGCDGYFYQLQYSENGTGWTALASGPSYNGFTYPPSVNGQYRIIIIKAGCPGASAQTSVNCVVNECNNQPTVLLNNSSSSQCNLSSVSITGTRGGSATSVSATVSVNAGGSLTPSSSASSSFAFTYTPVSGDIGKTITVTVTTNNPLGSPCQPSTATYTLEVLSNPTVSITSGGGNLCVNQSRNLIATPIGGSWTVASGPGQIVGNTLTPTGAGSIVVNYSVTANGCSGSSSQTITAVAVPTSPVATVNCDGGFNNAVITVTSPIGAGIEYRLNTGVWQSSTTFGSVANGNQTLQVRNSTGCESSGIVSVNCGCANSPNIVIQNNEQQCGIGVKTINVSFTGATNVTATLSVNASGSLSGTSFSTSPFSFTYTPSISDYNKTIIITLVTNNPLGSPCVADQKTYSLSINPPPTALISGAGAICLGTSAVLTASGGVSYAWNSPLGTGASKTVNPTTTTTYTVMVTSSNGCTSTASKTVNVNMLPGVLITSSSTPLCIGQQRTLVGSPIGGVFSITGVGILNGNVLTSGSAGTANVTYTYSDGSGCQNTATQSITIAANPSTPTVSVDCSSGFGNGVITVTAPTGAGLEYRLNAGSWQSSNVFSGVSNATYAVSLRNASGCEASNNITINCGCVNAPSITLSSASGSTCGTTSITISGNVFGGSATQVTATENGSGSLSSSTFNSSPFSFTYTPSAGDIGNTVTITFTSNNPLGSPCQPSVVTYTLQVLPNPTAAISGELSACFGNTVSWTATGGTSYSWSSGLGIGATKTISSAGTYTVTVTGSNGCTSTASRTFTINALPTPSITSSSSNLCVGSTRTLVGSPTGGTWSVSGQGQITGSTLTANTSGTANITYTYVDGNGCQNTAIQSITLVAIPTTPSATVDCALGFGSGVITVTSPTGAGLEYRLNTGTWQSSTNFSSIANGTYTLSVRNSSGCESITTVNVNCGCINAPSITLASASGSTCGTNAITISGNVYGGSATQVTATENGLGSLSSSTFSSSPFAFTYTPNSGDIGNTITIIFTTNNPFGAPCQATSQSYTLQVLPNPTATISGLTAICAGSSTSWTASGGTSYDWASGLGPGSTKTVSTGGTYTVTVTSSNGCTSTATRTLTVNPLPTPSITSSSANLCVGSTRTLVGSPTGGIFTNTGQGQITGNTLTANTSGTASITYTYVDGNGCQNTTTQSITLVAIPTPLTATVNCTGGAGNGIIDVTSPTGAGIEYRLNAGAWQSGTSFSSLANGSYTLWVRNSSGCENSTIINVNCGCANSPTLVLSASSGTTCGTNVITVSSNTFGGSATQVTLSENGAGSLNISSATISPFSFTYTPVAGDIGNFVTITINTNNPLGAPCQPITQTYILQVLQLPTAAIGGNNVICNGASTTITASGGASYVWSGGLGTSAGITVSPSANTTYTVTVTGSNGCTSTASRAVTVNPLPTPSITSSSAVICVNATRTLVGSPIGGVFTITSGGGVIVGNTLTATGAGTISILYTYTDGNGCVGTTTQNITASANPSTPTTTSSCTATSISSVTVTAPTGAGIEYQLNGGTWQGSNVFANVGNGTHTINVRNASGCTSTGSISTNCGCFSAPTVSISPTSSSICGLIATTINGIRGGSATLVNFTHNGSGNLSVPNSASASWSVVYTPGSGDIGNVVTITATTNNPDGSPCVAASATYQLTINALPNASISGNNIICIGASTTLTASGGSSYSWSGGLGTGASKTLSPTTTTSYTVTVTGSNGCTSTASRTVTVNTLPTPSITSSSAAMCIGQTRTLVGSPSGGTFSIISGSGSITGNVLTTTGASTINIQYAYTDGNGCSATTTQNITVVANPTAPSLSFVCTATSLSTITVSSPTGAGIEYNLNGGTWQSGATFTNVANGSYTVNVRNSTGCTSAGTITTSCGCFSQPTVSISPTSNAVCGLVGQTVNGTRGGSATLVNFTHNGSGSLSVSSSASSSWSVTYTPSSGDLGNVITITATTNNPDGSPCNAASATYQLTVNALPVGVISGTISICSGQSTTWTASGGSSYSWSSGLGSGSTKTISSAGTYTVTVTASNGCTSTATRTLTVNALPNPSITSSNANLCVGSSRSLTASPTGGNWSVVSGNASINGSTLSANGSGSATIRYTYIDGNGCTAFTDQSISFIANPTEPTVNATCTGTNKSTVTITPPVSGGPYAYSYNGSAYTSTTVYTNVPNGNHSISMINLNNCEVTKLFSTNCGCFVNPSISLSSTSGEVCGTTPITVSGNTFIAATQVTATENGGGSLTLNTFNNSPFSFTYTPSVSDIGNNVQIVFTSNNPDGAPCSGATAIYNLTVKALPFATISGNTQICTGQSTILTASAGSSYAWSGGLGSGASKTVSSGGTYTVTVTGANGCTAVASTTVTQSPIPIIDDAILEDICFGQTKVLNLSPSGGFYQLLSAPVGTSLSGGNVLVAGNNAGSATVRYTYTSVQGCSSSSDITIGINEAPAAPIISVSNCMNGVGTVTVTSPTGVELQYRLNNGSWQSSNVFGSVSNGVYQVSVRNASGCESNGVANVNCPSCVCNATLNVSGQCTISLTSTCAGYDIQYQESSNGTSGWLNVGTVNVNSYLARPNKYYRVRFTSMSCSDFFSNVVLFNTTYNPTTNTLNTTISQNHLVNGAWGILGTKFYNGGSLPVTTSSTANATVNSGSTGWKPADVYNSRMNASGVTLGLNSNIATYVSNVNAVSIGFASDDIGEMCVNGVKVFELIDSPVTTPNFRWWYVVNRVVNIGDVITIKYSDVNGQVDGFGFELYGQNYATMLGYDISQINLQRLQSARSTQTTYYRCPTGTKPDASITVCNPVPKCVCEN